MPSNAAPPNDKPSPATRAVARWRAALLLALLCPTLALGLLAAWLHRQAFDDALVRADRAGRIGQEHVLGLLGTHDMLLQRTLDVLAASTDDELRGRDAEMQWQLRRLAESLPTVQGLVALDAEGRLLASNRALGTATETDFSQHAGYRALRRPEAPALHVSAPIEAGDGAVEISRRRVHADGRFAGLVQVSLRPQDLVGFQRELAGAEPGLSMTLMRTDGIVIAQASNGAHAAPFDPASQLRSLRRVGSYPLAVAAAIDPSVVTAAWQQRVWSIALAVLPLTLGLAGLAALALRRTRNEHAHRQQRDHESRQQQRAELALLQAQKLEALGHLSNNVAHDVNHVLTVAERNLELLRCRHPDAASAAPLDEIGHALQSGTRLTRQLLSCGGEQVLRPERLVLQERLPEIQPRLQSLLGAGIELVCAVEESTAPVRADAAELELALINLAGNARDAMPDGGRLMIRARNASPGLVQIEVQDTGDGIDPAVARRAFDAFFSTKPKGRGNGLGLTQAQAFCQAAGGHARIGPALGGGTRVQLLLPGETVPALPDHTAPAPSAAHESESALDTL